MNVQGRNKRLLYAMLGFVVVGAVLGVSALMILRQQPRETPPPKPTAAVATPTMGTVPMNGKLIPYTPIPGAVKSPVQVKVNGQDVFVEKYKDISYARFAFSGAIKVEVSGPSAAAYQISPRSYNIQASQSANGMSFALQEPRKLILQAGKEKLFIFADAPEMDAPQLSDADVIDVTTYVKDKNGKTLQTAQIQQALDEASTKSGIVYFPNGKYLTGTLKIKSNTSVYLESGALLMGTGRVQDYQETNFLLFDNADNAKLYGRGVIDARGKTLRTSANGQEGDRVKILRSLNGHNLTIEDVLLRDAGSWTVHILGTDKVDVTNVKIINDVTNTNGDGIDPDGASNVTVDGAFIYTTDDCFAVKTSGNFDIKNALHNVLIKNAVCYTKKSALKVGTETRADLSNITFERNDVVHADRAIALYMYDGTTMKNIKYINNYSEVIGGDSKQRLIDINIRDRKGVGFIKGVEIINYVAYQKSPKDSLIEGMDGHEIDVSFTNLMIEGKIRTNAKDAKIEVREGRVKFHEDQANAPQLITEAKKVNP